MDGKEDEAQKMREAALKVIGQRSNYADKNRGTSLSPKWQTLIDDDIVEAYRASFRKARRQRPSISTDSDIVPQRRPNSMFDIPHGRTQHYESGSRSFGIDKPENEDAADSRGDNLNERIPFHERPSLVSMYGRLWKSNLPTRKDQYNLDAAEGGIQTPLKEAVELARFQRRHDQDESPEKLPPNTFEMIPYPDSQESDQEATAETALTHQATLPIRRRSVVEAAAVSLLGPPPDYNEVVDPSGIRLETIESGRVESEETRENNYECTNLGPLNELGTRAVRVFGQKRTKTKLLCLVICIIGILGLIVFLGVFPRSFVYVEYYEIALARNSITGTVDRDTTYYPGCYVLGPSTEFIKFPGTADFISRTDDIFSVDRLIITLSYSLQYFIRPQELGKLHKDYEKSYESVIESIARSTLKNQAWQFSVDEYRLNRPRLEKHFHDAIKRRLQGTCCESCCPKNCKNNTVCATCDSSSSCDQAYHVDITYFQMGRVSIPNDVFERFLQQVLLQVAAEREFFIQEHQVTVKETERMTKNVTNHATEIIQNSTAVADKIDVLAKADREAEYTNAYVQALRKSCQSLNITKEENKLSFLMMRVLEDANAKDHLYRGYNYQKNILLTN